MQGLASLWIGDDLKKQKEAQKGLS